MGKRISQMFQKVSNLNKIPILIARMRLVYFKKSTKLSKFKALKHYNSYGFLQERQFSPSSTPLIRFHRQKSYRNSVYSICYLSCFSGPRYEVVMDENYPYESAIVEVKTKDEELLFGEEEKDEQISVDERAERFIERFYAEMKRQRRESISSSSAGLQHNRLLEY